MKVPISVSPIGSSSLSVCPFLFCSGAAPMDLVHERLPCQWHEVSEHLFWDVNKDWFEKVG